MRKKFLLLIIPILFCIDSFSQDFKIENAYYKGEGRELVYPYNGIIKITEDKLIMDTDILFLDAATYKDSKGNLKIQYQNLEFTIEVKNESGVFNKKKYDTIIIQKTKDQIGGSVNIYYCTKI